MFQALGRWSTRLLTRHAGTAPRPLLLPRAVGRGLQNGLVRNQSADGSSSSTAAAQPEEQPRFHQAARSRQHHPSRRRDAAQPSEASPLRTVVRNVLKGAYTVRPLGFLRMVTDRQTQAL